MTLTLIYLTPVVLLTGLCLWTWALVESLRREHPYPWVVFLVFLPPVVVPIYLVNYFVMGDPIGRGIIRHRMVRRSQILRGELAEAETIGRREELASTLMDLQDWQGALNELAHLIDHDEDSLRYQYWAGKCLMRLQRPEQAAVHLQFVVDSEPRYDQGGARLGLALALESLGRRPEAIEELDKAIQHLAVPRTIYEYTRMMVGEGRAAEARKRVLHLIDAHRDDPVFFTRENRRWIEEARNLLPDVT